MQDYCTNTKALLQLPLTTPHSDETKEALRVLSMSTTMCISSVLNKFSTLEIKKPYNFTIIILRESASDDKLVTMNLRLLL